MTGKRNSRINIERRDSGKEIKENIQIEGRYWMVKKWLEAKKNTVVSDKLN